MMVSISFSLYAGTESGGGGGVVWVNSRPVLMDYFTMIDKVEEIPMGEVKITNDSDVKSSPAFLNAQKILEKWSGLQFVVMSSIVKMGMESSLHWSFVDTEVKAPAFYLAPAIPEGSKVETVAYYHYNSRKEVGVQINQSLWEQLDLQSQTGLILHEALREVQIGWKSGFDDQALQRSTVIYLMCHPTNRLNYYMFYVLNNSPEIADKIYGPFRTFIEQECRRIK